MPEFIKPKMIISESSAFSIRLVRCFACVVVLITSTKINAVLAQDIPQQKDILPSETVIEIPTPPAIALPDNGHSVEITPPLAWRQRALAMTNEMPFKEKNSLLWALPLAYDQAQALLKMAIQQVGLKLTAAYQDAGQYLISDLRPQSNSGQIIIVSQPVDKSRTIFRLRIYSYEQSATGTKARKIPVLMKELLDNPGLWQ